MSGLYHCTVAYAHLGNGIGRKTLTMAALLPLTGSPVRYEAVLHNNLLVFVSVCEGVYAGGSLEWTIESMLRVEGQAQYMEGMYAVVSWGKPSMRR